MATFYVFTALSQKYQDLALQSKFNMPWTSIFVMWFTKCNISKRAKWVNPISFTQCRMTTTVASRHVIS